MSDVTPTPSVGIVIFEGNRVLLVKHGPEAEQLTDTYGLPSGRLEEGESPIAAAKRELLEESGLVTREEDLVELPEKYEAKLRRKDGTVRLFSWIVFLCTAYSGQLTPSNETIPEWVAISELKKYQLLANVENAISQALKYKNQ